MDDDRKKFEPKRAAGKPARPAEPLPHSGREGPARERPAAKFDKRRDGDRPAPAPGHGKAVLRPRRTEDTEPGERISKRLARAGIASRRDAEALIAAGRVSVNGRTLSSPALNVSPEDTIAVDGTPIPPIERTRLFLFHKAAGLVTTNRDPEGRRTVFDVLPPDLPRLMTIGRLDVNTEGLLLLTNDGGLARVLELPSTGWLRRYRVRVHGRVDTKALADLREGIAVDGVFYGSIEAALDREQGSNAWLTIGLREGKNREVKNILGALGLEVSRLIRISYGPFQLGELPEGHVQEIKGRLLRDQLGERLIEESGANFEAPVLNPFSNRPVRKELHPAGEGTARPKVQRDGERGRVDEGGLIRNRKRRENARSEALGKLSTRPERGRAPTDAHGARRERPPIEPPGARKANVWMAPGARPIGAGRAAAEKAEAEARRKARKGEGRPAFGKDDRGRRSETRGRPETEPGAAHPRERSAGSGKPPPGRNRPPGSQAGRGSPRGKGPGTGPRKR